jgi:lipopolysaccharide exporter
MKNLGYVTFAKKYAEFSIRLITDNVNRVAFPVFSRLQKNLPLLKKSVEKILFFETLLTFPIIIGAIFIFDNLLKILPGYYQKWQLALFSFYFFSLSALFVSSTTGLINLFNAVGKVKFSLYFMILWTGLTWILVPVLIKFFGYNGIALAFFLMNLINIFIFFVAKKLVNFSLANSIRKPLIGTLIIAIYLFLIKKTVGNLYFNLLLSFSGAIGIYTLIILKNNRHLIDELKTLLNNTKKTYGN